MYSLISFPDNYGDQTGLGTTGLQHFNIPTVGKLILKSGFKKKKKGFVVMTYNPGSKNLPLTKNY